MKYRNGGNIESSIFNNWGIDDEVGQILTDRANKALSHNTWKQYKCAENHVKRCESVLNKSMSFPFNLEKTLDFVGYLIKDRNCSSNTINSYLSAIRMAHLSKGVDCPHLRQPIIDLILKGQAHHDALKTTIERKQNRMPVTIPVLKFIKRKLKKMKWSRERKYRVWSAACLLWNGVMRVHEALSKEKYIFDTATTLLFEDVVFDKVKVEGENKEILKVKLKCPKESSVGNGVVIEILRNDSFFCAISALKKYLKTSPVKFENGKPLFRMENGANYTGREFNKDLAELTAEITEGTTGVIRSHSFRAGVASEMGLAGFSDSQIMSTGRWSSSAFLAYCKLPRSKRLKFQNELVKKAMGNHK